MEELLQYAGNSNVMSVRRERKCNVIENSKFFIWLYMYVGHCDLADSSYQLVRNQTSGAVRK